MASKLNRKHAAFIRINKVSECSWLDMGKLKKKKKMVCRHTVGPRWRKVTLTFCNVIAPRGWGRGCFYNLIKGWMGNQHLSHSIAMHSPVLTGTSMTRSTQPSKDHSDTQGERLKEQELGSNRLEENCHIQSRSKSRDALSSKGLKLEAAKRSLSQHKVLPLFPSVPPFPSTWQAAEGGVFLFIYDLQVWSGFQVQPVSYAPLKKSRWR